MRPYVDVWLQLILLDGRAELHARHGHRALLLDRDVDRQWPVGAAVECEGHGEALAVEWVVGELVDFDKRPFKPDGHDQVAAAPHHLPIDDAPSERIPRGLVHRATPSASHAL